MSTQHTPKKPFDNFIDALTDELIAMPDEQVLEGADATAVKARGLAMLEAAKAEAGRRRMTAAKAGAADVRAQSRPTAAQAVTVAEARQYIQRAANDARYTLAARSLGEMSDEDVLRLYAQIKELEGKTDREPGTRT
jgi:hypothetical protein